MIVTIEPASAPVFRFSTGAGEAAKLLEVRITEVGATQPSWWLVHEDNSMEDSVLLNILTAEEAERGGVPVVRRLDNDQEKLVADLGVLVARLEYGQVPRGLRQHGPLQPLKPHHLYEVVAVGATVGELEFYA